MLGRANPGQAEVKFESGKKLIRRFENVQRTQQEFWKRWIEEVFPERLKQSKWRQEKRDLKVGDIVLRKDETAAGQTYKYARVVKVHVSTDGKVRAADIEYKLPGEAVFRMTTRPVHKLVMVIPVEEQTATVGDMEEREKAPPTARALTPSRAAVTEPGQASPPGAEPEAAGQAELETKKRRGPEVAEPHPPLDGGGGSEAPHRTQESDLKKEGQ
jgi:hypothetical protein